MIDSSKNGTIDAFTMLSFYWFPQGLSFTFLYYLSFITYVFEKISFITCDLNNGKKRKNCNSRLIVKNEY